MITKVRWLKKGELIISEAVTIGELVMTVILGIPGEFYNSS